MKNKERADYGKYLIEKLHPDLGIDLRLMHRMVKFYRVYPIVVTLSPQLAWSHYVELIELRSDKERRFYENKIIANSWSVRELRNNINNHLYQKTNDKEIGEQIFVSVYKTKLPNEEKIKRVIRGL